MTESLSLPLVFGASEWTQLFLHYLMLSLLSIGGAIGTAPDMHRFLVVQHHWLSDAQFNASIAIAQAAPGPNVLFVALLGWNVGMNAGGMLTGLLGALVCLTAIMLPSTLLTYWAAQWGYRNRTLRPVRAFKQGMAPLVVALMMATSWILTTTSAPTPDAWRLWLLTAVSALIVWRTRLHLLWLLGAGALLGALGLV